MNADNCNNLKGVDIFLMDSIQIGFRGNILLQTRNYVEYHNSRNTDFLADDVVVAYGTECFRSNKGIVSVALYFSLTATQRENQYDFFVLKEQKSKELSLRIEILWHFSSSGKCLIWLALVS